MDGFTLGEVCCLGFRVWGLGFGCIRPRQSVLDSRVRARKLLVRRYPYGGIRPELTN